MVGRESDSGASISMLGVQALVVLLWCWSWIPQMIDLINLGRQSPALGVDPGRSAGAEMAYTAIIRAIIAVSLFLIISALTSRQPIRLRSITLLLAPWVTLNGSYVIQGGTNKETLLFPFVVLAFALNARNLRKVYALLRSLLYITALSSLVLGIMTPSLYLSDPSKEVGNEKAIVGSLLLNGLFPTSNQLGVTLGIGIPLIVMTSKRKTKWIGVSILLLAMAWASSRTSLAATAVVLLVMAFGARGGERTVRSVIRPAVVGLCLLAVVTPFVFRDPKDFNGRVAIWRTSLDFVTGGHLLDGGGAMIFREVSPVTTSIGAITSTGHNIFVTVLTVGGLIALAAVAALWTTYLATSIHNFSIDRYPVIFLLSVSAVAILEDPVRAFVIAPSAFLLVPIFVMPLVMAEHRRKVLEGSFSQDEASSRREHRGGGSNERS